MPERIFARINKIPLKSSSVFRKASSITAFVSRLIGDDVHRISLALSLREFRLSRLSLGKQSCLKLTFNWTAFWGLVILPNTEQNTLIPIFREKLIVSTSQGLANRKSSGFLRWFSRKALRMFQIYSEFEYRQKLTWIKN